MKRVIVTPAGRERYLQRLLKHLERQKSDFDEWHLWMNTRVASDIAYAEKLAATYPWISTVYLPEKENDPNTEYNNYRICRFFPLDAVDRDAVYLRLDDDVVWLEPTFVSKMFDYRLSHPEPFLIYGNIINNAILSHLHQRAGLLPRTKPAGYACMDDVGWRDPVFAEEVHMSFLRSSSLKQWQHFQRWTLHLDEYERCSINAISWTGNEFAAFGGKVGNDEEQWLSVDKPRELGRPNEINGQAVCVHFSFYTQRDHLDATDILEQYDAFEFA
jgi:hypothetical protein